MAKPTPFTQNSGQGLLGQPRGRGGRWLKLSVYCFCLTDLTASALSSLNFNSYSHVGKMRLIEDGSHQ